MPLQLVATGQPAAPPDAWDYSLRLPHHPVSPGIARATARVILGRHDLRELIEVAELLTSELATNCYVHTRGPARLRLAHDGGVLRVSLWDTSPRLRSRTRTDARTESGTGVRPNGRGLVIVGAYADDWGWYALDEQRLGVGGKIVWCELRQ
ncbi:ATP-binding protein [Streptomyces sp. MST-110588]|uniref:ATP-binding protein n=1 Tax=Streptomyces sp. MST-110588 TaxID=2833628 RepID=UPI001F5DEF00|nr:ATP-binding protein [Streptomyces sp. MST-110588]UNO40167.1 ATP-binding protein [Streptomyces sp. MST-110588]